MALSDFRPERDGRSAMHVPPYWVSDNATFFITINCLRRNLPQLTVADVPGKLFSSIDYYCRMGRWWPEVFLLMPDHVHALVVFAWPEGFGMNAVVNNWKRYTARHLGIAWQRDYFDHRIRNDADHAQKWSYIRDNPVSKGLVARYDQWPHVWLPNRLGWPEKQPGDAADADIE